MIVFWVAAALLSVAVAVLIVSRAARAADRLAAEDPTLAVYRRQLGEIDDLAARGLLPEGEQRSARTEASRRLLAAAETNTAPIAAGGRNRTLVIALAAAAPLAAVGLYLLIGSPGMADLPFAQRLKAWRAEPARLDPERMAAVLQQVAAEHPGDPAPLVYLARAEVAAGDLASAEQDLRRALVFDPKRPDLWGLLGETLAMQAGDAASPAARAAFQHAYDLDPSQPGPRFYIGRDQIAGGDVRGGLATWKALEARLAATDPRRTLLEQQMAVVKKTGALPSSQPQEPASDQQALIRAMVSQLAAQLEMQPDNPQGWGRLIRSYGVLGDEPRRQAALARAQALFKDHPDAWKQVEDAEANGQ
jgi:cytochrome c-type biogenesis protein CcmH